MNQNKTQFFQLLLTCLFLGIGCTATNKIVKTDRLEKQYENSLGKLNQGKVTEQNKESLTVSLTKIIERESPKRDSLINSENLIEKEKGLEINEYLIKKITNTDKYTGTLFTEKLKGLEKDKQEARTILKNEYLAIGKTNLSQGLKEKNKSLTKTAYLAFVKSEKYGKQNVELDALKKESFEFSNMIYNITTQSSSSKEYNDLINNRFKEIEKLERQFKKIYYEKTGLEKLDCNIEITLDELVISNEEGSNSQQFSKQVQEVKADGTTEAVTVHGSIIKNRTIKKAYWDVKINISSNSINCDLKSKMFREEFKFESVRISTSGDGRAIPDHFKGTIEEMLPRDTEIAEELIERICKKIETYFL